MTPSSKIGLLLHARLKEAGIPDPAALALAKELCNSFVTKEDLEQTDSLREARTEARIAVSVRNLMLFLAVTVVLSGVVGRIIWGG